MGFLSLLLSKAMALKEPKAVGRLASATLVTARRPYFIR